MIKVILALFLIFSIAYCDITVDTYCNSSTCGGTASTTKFVQGACTTFTSCGASLFGILSVDNNNVTIKVYGNSACTAFSEQYSVPCDTCSLVSPLGPISSKPTCGASTIFISIIALFGAALIALF